jgi:hypothetical protein
MLWVDQLCTDQSSIVERNHQVKLMAEIFTRVVIVVAWLGRGNETTEKSMRVISEFPFKKNDDLRATSKKAKKWLLTENYHRGMVASSLFHRPYWTRLWIVQEFILPEQLVIACGQGIVPWPDLRTYYRHH